MMRIKKKVFYGNYDFIELNNEIELNANSHMVELLKKNIK
mgnify:CR=1 FL=1